MTTTPLARPGHFAPPFLDAHDVHLWSIELDVDAKAQRDLVDYLSTDELEKANRLRRERDRDRFIVAHARVRQLLAAYTGIAPMQLSFAVGAYGKPALIDSGKAPDLRFNLSHSDHRALLALARGREIGVDIEEQREMPESENIARRHFAPSEFQRWIATPASRRVDAFFCCWTRKEAYVKALGGGLSIDLASFEVSIDPDSQARLLSIGGSAQAASSWTMWSIELAPAFRGALAVNGTGLALQRFEGL